MLRQHSELSIEAIANGICATIIRSREGQPRRSDHAVAQLKEHRDPWCQNGEAPRDAINFKRLRRKDG